MLKSEKWFFVEANKENQTCWKPEEDTGSEAAQNSVSFHRNQGSNNACSWLHGQLAKGMTDCPLVCSIKNQSVQVFL